MGIAPLWRLRGAPTDALDVASQETARDSALSPSRHSEPAPVVPPVQATAPDASTAVETPSQRRSPSPKLPPKTSVASLAAGCEPAHAPTDAARAERIGRLDWIELENEIRSCRSCVLCEKRKQAVPGVGDRSAGWMLVGEAPGAEEDQRGEPFVGQAGKLLDNMLAAVGLKREEGAYIANAVKCRPPHNRTPEAGEIAACLPFLERQIALVQPRLLLALGRPAAQALLNTEVSIGAARGKRFEYRGIPVVVSYHPAYLLRNPQDKGKAWEDLCLARRLVPPE